MDDRSLSPSSSGERSGASVVDLRRHGLGSSSLTQRRSSSSDTPKSFKRRRRSSKGKRRERKTRYKHRKRRRGLPSTDSSSSGDSGSELRDDSSEFSNQRDESGESDGDDSLVIDAQDELVAVPEIDVRQFESWAALESYLKTYAARTFQIFSTRTATPYFTRNRKIREAKVPCAEIPEQMGFYNKTYLCTHAGSPRTRLGRIRKGERPHQHSRRIGCNAKINACVSQVTATDWQVCITKQIALHNHDVGTEVYRSYHEARRVLDEEVLSTVRVLDRCGANRKRILEYISENTTVEPSMRDVHNLVRRLKEETYNFPTMEERIQGILTDFSAVKGNITRVYANDSGVVECISIQSSHMRTMFAHFPEVLLIDATHDTNASNYKLFSFMVHDTLGNGQHVQHCLVENERKPALHTACKQFKEGCGNYDSIAVMIIDKDSTELGVLEDEFPGARVLLCHFHVIKYLQEELSKERYNLDAWTKKEMKRLVRLLVSAPTDSCYEKYIAAMRVVLRTEEKRQLWFEYFDLNWTSCKVRWSSAHRGNVPHLGNHTNNRLESSWQKIKTLVNRSTTLDDCVVAILFWQTMNERAWARSVNRIGVYVNADYDEELNRLSNSVSRHALAYIKQQYEFALMPNTKYHYYPVGPYVMMQYTSIEAEDVPEEYMLNLDEGACSCMFRVTRLLPCRHLIYYRKHSGCAVLVPESMIHSRWLVQNYRRLKKSTLGVDEVENPFEIRDVKPMKSKAAKTQNVKYRELLAVAKQIAEVGCEWNTIKHATLSSALLQVLKVVKSGACPEIGNRRDSLEELTTSVESQNQVQSHSQNEIQSQTGDASQNGDQMQLKDVGLSPSGRALYALVNDIDTEGFCLAQSVVVDVYVEVETTGCGVVPSNKNMYQSETVRGSPTLIQSENVDVSTNGNDGETQQVDDNSECGRTKAPQWKISQTVKKSGRPKLTQAKKKAADRQAMRETVRRVEAIAAGNMTSVATLLAAVQCGVPYSEFSAKLRSLTILQQRKRSKIVVHERRLKSATPEKEIMTVLSISTLDSCGTEIALFQNRWKSVHDASMPQHGLTVMIAKTVYEVATLKAMRNWHTAMNHFDVIDSSVKWVETYDFCQWNAGDTYWSEGLLK